MSNNKSPHILSTASNLLGFCLLVLTSLKISKFQEATIIDEFTGIASLLLIASSILSFLSMRSKNEKKGENFEKIADIIFLIALIIIFTITFLVAFFIVF
ncbi:Hypothetical protein IALB_0169 [Ignavibacterium album JCM 16511]|uniref:Uncharacterized protein n=1 Tax=Ignavibacterium album (strain DSM 19864 / JCM 16511 / NBRC 101810 / Mat9-16) TaxID=945713 RepID=I0AFX4_IGNAJ|nr:hypothetical protein [Ignavibacterium album]AFH47881.1 Hypothetical protein IALB_0169 [Ignavibacterium album JCM 16511]